MPILVSANAVHGLGREFEMAKITLARARAPPTVLGSLACTTNTVTPPPRSLVASWPAVEHQLLALLLHNNCEYYYYIYVKYLPEFVAKRAARILREVVAYSAFTSAGSSDASAATTCTHTAL